MNIALPWIPNDSLCIFSTLPLNLNAQAPINLQLERNLILHLGSPSRISAINTLKL